MFHSLFFPCSSTFFCSFALTGRTPCTFKVIKHIASVIDDGLTVNLSKLTTFRCKIYKTKKQALKRKHFPVSVFFFRIPDSSQQLFRLGPVQTSHFRPSPDESHSRPQSPSFLGHVVGKRGAATGRLQIKPSGSGDENVRICAFLKPHISSCFPDSCLPHVRDSGFWNPKP